jgi:ferredoxin
MKLAFWNSLIGLLAPSLRTYHRAVGIEIDIDRDACMGSGNCVFAAPGVFELDDDSVARVVDPEASPEEAVVTAARQCPTHAITVRRDGVVL